jgi:predicted SprT family Zn-dependent metalloprotease
MFDFLARLFSPPRIRRKATPKRVGSTYDLKEIYDRIKAKHFTSSYDATIGWAPARPSSFRSITFGTYNRDKHHIKINPILDHPEVPLYFIEFVIYHEMLHAVCPFKYDRQGRCFVHTPEFRAKEKLFPHFKAAKEWEETSLRFFRRLKVYGRS